MSRAPVSLRTILMIVGTPLVSLALAGCGNDGSADPGRIMPEPVDMPSDGATGEPNGPDSGVNNDGGQPTVDATTDTDAATPPSADAGIPIAPPETPKRIVLIYTAHGTIAEQWRPQGPRNDFRLRPMLSPLRPFRDRMVMVDGLGMAPEGDTRDTRVSHMFLGHLLSGADPNGPRMSGGGGSGFLPASPTLDHRLADLFAAETRLPRVGFKLARYYDTVERRLWERLSYSDHAHDLEVQPDQFFHSHFGDVAADSVRSRSRELFQRLRRDAEELDTPSIANYERFANYTSDLVAFLLSEDTTRVVLWNLGSNRTFFTQASNGRTGRLTDMAHNSAADFEVQQRWFAERIAHLAERLDAVPDGDGTLLDRTIVVWLTEVGAGSRGHSQNNIPIILFGGAIDTLPYGEYLTVENGRVIDLLATVAAPFGLDSNTLGPPDNRARILPELVRR